MRSALAVALLIAFAGTAAAQRHGGRTVERTAEALPHPSIGLPLPSIGLPLPPIGLPLPPMGLSPLPPRTIQQPILRPGEPGRPGRGGRRNGGAFLYVPAFGWPYPYLPEAGLPSSPVPSLPTPPPYAPAPGYLRLDFPTTVDPQIYVDGYYVGVISDAHGELTLDAGHHAIELREEGYETLHVDVQIAADAVTTYRGTLKPIAPPRSVTPTPTTPSTLTPPSTSVTPPAPPPGRAPIYMIPGCYVGNVPPKEAVLPAGCDESGAIVFPSRP